MILVTGATGHLGNVLVRELISQGEKVRVMILPNETLASLHGLLVEVVTGDILNPDDLRRAMKEVNFVYHLAGIIAISPGMEKVMHRVNVEGARNVAEIALESGVERLVHVSSVHAFRREPHGVIMNEATPLALESPVGSYDRTKAEGTRAVLDFVTKGLDAVVVCPSGIIGLHDYANSLMGDTILSFSGKKLSILIDGAFDFVDVRDVVSGLLKAGKQGKRGEIYILSGSRVSVENLHEMAQSAVGSKSSKVIVPIRLAMFAVTMLQRFFSWLKIKTRYTSYSLQTLIDNSAFSSEKAKLELGYMPRPLSESIADFLKWHKLQYSNIGKKINKKKAKPVKCRLVKSSGQH